MISGYLSSSTQQQIARHVSEDDRRRAAEYRALAHSWPSLREAMRGDPVCAGWSWPYRTQFYGITVTQSLLEADDVLYDYEDTKLWPVRLVTTCIPEVRRG